MFNFKVFILTLLCVCSIHDFAVAQSGTKQTPPAMQKPQQTPNNLNNKSNAAVEEPPKFMGKIAKIETKGKINTLEIDVEGKTQEVIMTPKIKFTNETAGDLTALKEGVYVETKVNQPNDRSLVALEVKVYPGIKGKLPSGQILAAPAMVGESKNNLLISGKIVSLSDKSAFEGYQDLNIQAGPKSATIQIPQRGFAIQLVETDSSKLKVGDKVELQGTMLKNGKMNVSAVKSMAE